MTYGKSCGHELDARKFDVQLRLYQMKMKMLWKDFVTADKKDKRKIENMINSSVEHWNEMFPKGENYFDLHWMTVKGALQYVQKIVEATEETKRRTNVYLETGKGNNSSHGIGKIKRELKKKFGDELGYNIDEHPKNHGVLRMVVKGTK